MGVVRAKQKEDDGHGEEELLGRSVLGAVVDLLPHVEVVEGAGVELEGHAADVMEHDVRPKHVRDVGERPRRLLRYAGHDVVEDLEAGDQDKVDRPGTCGEKSQYIYIPSQSSIHGGSDAPFAFTQSAFRLGSAAWSLICSSVSGGSW